MNGYFEKLEKNAKENWSNIMRMDGITSCYTVQEFYAEMQAHKEERDRAKTLIESKIPSTITVGSMFNGGIRNYFIINDMCYGAVCEKCNSTGAVILISDTNNAVNWDEKILLPSLEYYYALGIGVDDIELIKHQPIPVNYKTDYWYCPYCNEMHKFKYDGMFGLKYDQEVMKMDIDIDKYLKKDSDLIYLKQMKKILK